jgi:hypothetical protein
MTTARGKQSPAGGASEDPRDDEEGRLDEEGTRPIPELVRRALTLGLSGFFTTEEALRRALGDTVPKDWTDFLAETSERTRSEFLERMSHEIGRVLEGVDIGAVLRTLLEGRTLEVKAQFRLTDAEGGNSPAIRFSVSDDEDT